MRRLLLGLFLVLTSGCFISDPFALRYDSPVSNGGQAGETADDGGHHGTVDDGGDAGCSGRTNTDGVGSSGGSSVHVGGGNGGEDTCANTLQLSVKALRADQDPTANRVHVEWDLPNPTSVKQIAVVRQFENAEHGFTELPDVSDFAEEQVWDSFCENRPIGDAAILVYNAYGNASGVDRRTSFDDGLGPENRRVRYHVLLYYDDNECDRSLWVAAGSVVLDYVAPAVRYDRVRVTLVKIVAKDSGCDVYWRFTVDGDPAINLPADSAIRHNNPQTIRIDEHDELPLTATTCSFWRPSEGGTAHLRGVVWDYESDDPDSFLGSGESTLLSSNDWSADEALILEFEDGDSDDQCRNVEVRLDVDVEERGVLNPLGT